MAAIVTRDIKRARHIVVINPRWRYNPKSLAHRVNRHVERIRLAWLGPDYEPLLKPRLTCWDLC